MKLKIVRYAWNLSNQQINYLNHANAGFRYVYYKIDTLKGMIFFPRVPKGLPLYRYAEQLIFPKKLGSTLSVFFYRYVCSVGKKYVKPVAVLVPLAVHLTVMLPVFEEV